MRPWKCSLYSRVRCGSGDCGNRPLEGWIVIAGALAFSASALGRCRTRALAPGTAALIGTRASNEALAGPSRRAPWAFGSPFYLHPLV
jgi:hypothetical protein